MNLQTRALPAEAYFAAGRADRLNGFGRLYLVPLPGRAAYAAGQRAGLALLATL